MAHMKSFEARLREIMDGPGRTFGSALMAVTDTAFMCKLWLQEQTGDTWTAADMIALTRLVLEREAENLRELQAESEG